MNRYDDLSIDQIRNAMTNLNVSREMAWEGGAYGLYDAIGQKMDGLWQALLTRITSEDPCTTEADVRSFEEVYQYVK